MERSTGRQIDRLTEGGERLKQNGKGFYRFVREEGRGEKRKRDKKEK